MANLLDSYGLDFLGKDEDTLMGAVRYTVQEGKAIKGYYDTPYFYLPIGSAEFWASSEKSEDGKLAISGFHTHCGGKTIWEMICTDVDISPKDWPKTERILMMSRSTDNGGMLPVDIITADVLPSFLKDDRLTLQLVAPCLEVNYYATEEEHDKTVPADKRGKKWGVADGALIPLSFLANHLVGNYEDGKEYDNDAYVTFKAKVTRLCVGTVEIGDQKENTFIRCFADTVYGELEFDHSFDQVPEDLRDMCGPMGLFMSEISFQKLTEEQQKNLLAAAAEASAAHTAMAPEKEAVSLAEMESSGVDIVEVDVDSFAKAVNEFNIKYCEEKGWTDVYNKIVG